MNMGIYEKLLKLDSRIFQWILVLIVVVVMLNPIGLPINIDSTTREFVETIENLPEGSKVLYVGDCSIANWPDAGSATIACMKLLFSRPLKVVLWATVTDTIFTNQLGLDGAQREVSKKEYGVDYAVFGYIPGYETAVAALAADTWSNLVQDIDGTPIENLEIMQDIKNGGDFDMIIVNSGALERTWLYYIRHWQANFDLQTLVIATTGGIVDVNPYHASKQVTAWIKGSRGGAELELATGNPGDGIKFLDVQNIVHLLMIGMLIVINAESLIEWIRRDKNAV